MTPCQLAYLNGPQRICRNLKGGIFNNLAEFRKIKNFITAILNHSIILEFIFAVALKPERVSCGYTAAIWILRLFAHDVLPACKTFGRTHFAKSSGEPLIVVK